MKIAIATVQVPFITGGAEMHAASLRQELVRRGHSAEIVSIPFKWYPAESLIRSMLIGRLIDLTEVNGEKIDIVVGLKFPAYYVQHDHKVVWLLHQHRQAYDLWGTQYSDIWQWPNGEAVRDMIIRHDVQYLLEARKIFTNADNVTARLRKFNGLEGTTLYHPPPGYESLRCESYEDFVFYPSRIDGIKRQRLLVEAARHTGSSIRIVIAGSGPDSEVKALREMIEKSKLADRITLTGYISEEEKRSYYARARCVFFGGVDEDYGYVTLEAQYSKKPVVTLNDSGGALEFVVDGVSGYVCPPDPVEIAGALDRLAGDTELARYLGEQGHRILHEKNVSWDHVIASLLGT